MHRPASLISKYLTVWFVVHLSTEIIASEFHLCAKVVLIMRYEKRNLYRVMLEKNQKIINFQDIAFDGRSTVNETSLDASQKFEKFNLDKEKNRLTTGEKIEWHPSEDAELLQPKDTNYDERNVKSPSDAERPNDEVTLLNNEGTKIKDRSLKSVANY